MWRHLQARIMPVPCFNPGVPSSLVTATRKHKSRTITRSIRWRQWKEERCSSSSSGGSSSSSRCSSADSSLSVQVSYWCGSGCVIQVWWCQVTSIVSYLCSLWWCLLLQPVVVERLFSYGYLFVSKKTIIMAQYSALPCHLLIVLSAMCVQLLQRISLCLIKAI